ncbi:ATP-binding SpoIIE family protein phosphatase [Actinacidiphila acidipaludis]|uniref:SpoIIE family protein phosphatase n=1 Tax=Actinacidiphila acidipaludis TaxID=2873382 RepID=A0ABS7PZ08_9ACTN|nr:SpoIIE family protein phosphatase [Streptomyces acidipaludis]MBY8876129.1 SpoIIE family protein phosphatase [Streptomyces acidipaludis]
MTGTMGQLTARDRPAETAGAEPGRRVAALIGALIEALHPSEVLAAVTRHVLPLVGADGLVVHDVTGTSPQLIGVVGYPPSFTTRLRAMSGPPDDPTEDIGFVTSVGEFTRRWPALADLARLSGMRAWAMLPLVSRDRRVGSCVIAWKQTHAFRPEERDLLGTVAVYIATALDNARLYEQAHGRAERLQRELLPRTQPELVAVQTATRWRATAGQDVGGDWYDTVPLSGGRSLAVIGDVSGRGLEPSITMGILRHTVLTVAALDLPLDEVMARVGDVVARVGGSSPWPSFHATCLMALYDPTLGVCTLASAGHPAPVVVRPGQEPRNLDVTAGSPLGSARDLDRIPVPVTETVLEPGSTLVLFTRGLVGGAGTGRLIGVMSRYLATAPVPDDPDPRARWLSDMCTVITRELPPDARRQDDAALLALNTDRVPAADIAARDLPCVPSSAARARKVALGQLRAWGREDLSDEAALVVSELVGNTVRHAVGIGADAAGDDTGMIRLRLLRLGGSLICEVYDGSEATPRVRHPALDDEFGRGLQLVALTAAGWGARYTEHGKCIWASLG